jgi:hypothetical protein
MISVPRCDSATARIRTFATDKPTFFALLQPQVGPSNESTLPAQIFRQQRLGSARRLVPFLRDAIAPIVLRVNRKGLVGVFLLTSGIPFIMK